jgi:penicillin-binding protein 1C
MVGSEIGLGKGRRARGRVKRAWGRAERAWAHEKLPALAQRAMKRVWARAAPLLNVRNAPLAPAILAAAALLVWYRFCLPSPLFRPDYSTVVLDREGRLLGATVASDGQWRFPADGKVPEKLAAALVTAEDKRFWTHRGVDPLAVGRALLSNIRSGSIASGASTITMQVIRLSRPGKPRSLAEKMLEAALALRLELSASKGQILRLFASHAPFGGNVVGFETAAWRWFGRDAFSLSWAQSALLAVLPNNPGLIYPGRNREVLLSKRNRLLAVLRDRGFLDDPTCLLAQEEPLPQAPYPIPQYAPHLVQRIRTARVQSSGTARVQSSGTARVQSSGTSEPGAFPPRVGTTLDLDLQRQVNAVLARRGQEWRERGVANAAVLVLETGTGKVLAYAGNVPGLERNEDAGSVDIVTAPRSTGSLLKPFLYASMLEAGELLPRQLVPDIPTRMGSFMPENSSRTFSGAVAARTALAHSLNVPFVRLLRSFGVDRLADALKSLGMTTLLRAPSEYGLTLVLGGAEGSLWDLTGMYAGLARSAMRRPGDGASGTPFFAPRFTDADRPRQAEPGVSAAASKTSQGAAVMTSGAAVAAPGAAVAAPGAASCWLTLQALLEVERPGEEGAWRDYMGSKRIAWKTGTSYGYRDAWAIGVTPGYTVGVWVGNASGEGKPDIRGSYLAAPVLFDVFGLLPDTGWFARPDFDLENVRICRKSGFHAGMDCSDTMEDAAPARGLDAPLCPYCRIVHVDVTGTRRAVMSQDGLSGTRAVSWFVLPPAMEWYYLRAHPDYRPLPPLPRGLEGMAADGGGNLGVLFPEDGGRVYVPVDLDGKPGSAVFRAAHREAKASVFWHMDGEYLGETVERHEMEVRPGLGKHVLVLVDEYGEEHVRRFECLSEK